MTEQEAIEFIAQSVKSDADMALVADAIKALEQGPKIGKVIKMRDTTPEERELIYKYIKSISKPTGVDFWNSEQEPKWIPVSKRFPEEDGCYLVTTTGTNNNIIDIAYYTEGIWHKASKIKAWMPLPKPYEAESEEMDRLVSEQAVIDAICKVCAVEIKPSECRYRKGLFGGCKEYEAIKAIPSAEPTKDLLTQIIRDILAMYVVDENGNQLSRDEVKCGTINIVKKYLKKVEPQEGANE